MLTKVNITKFLIIFGFAVYIANYAVDLIAFYGDNDKASLVIEETEGTEKKEKDNSEKEDANEKDKITQNDESNPSEQNDFWVTKYPYYYSHNTSVYLEYATPPPELLS